MASVDPDTVPFWGVSDSNIQWCEEDYAVTPYLAEFWNSLSSIPLFLWGLFGLYMYYQHGEKEKRFASLFLCLSAVGFGSFAFHATMRRSAQVLDEAPMLYANFLFLFCLFDRRETPRPWVAYASLAACIILTGIYLLLPQFYLVFLGTYGSMVFGMTSGALYLICKPGTTLNEWRIGITALILYLAGSALWAFELAYCSVLPKWVQLHAIWHLFAGFGTYHFIMFLMAHRAREFNRPTTLHYGPAYATAYLYVGDKALKEV